MIEGERAPERAEKLLEATEREGKAQHDPAIRAGRFAERWTALQAEEKAAGRSISREQREAIAAEIGGDQRQRESSRRILKVTGSSRRARSLRPFVRGKPARRSPKSLNGASGRRIRATSGEASATIVSFFGGIWLPMVDFRFLPELFFP